MALITGKGQLEGKGLLIRGPGGIVICNSSSSLFASGNQIVQGGFLADAQGMLKAFTPITAAYFFNAIEGDQQLLWQDAAGTATPVTVSLDPVGAVRNTAGILVANQSTTTQRPQWRGTGNGIRFDRSDDNLVFNFPSSLSGALVIGTKTASYVLGISIPSGNYSYGRWELFDVVGLEFHSGATPEEVSLAINALVARGAAPFSGFSTVTNLSNGWRDRTDIVEFPTIDSSNVTNFSSTWQGCSNLLEFPLIDVSKATGFSNTWNGCSSLTSFPQLNTQLATSLLNAWFNCSGLTSFPTLNTSNVTNFSATWLNCTGLLQFPSINTSNGTNFSSAWQNCNKLTQFPSLNTSNGTNFNSAWRTCSALTVFPELNTSNGTSFASTWLGCIGLTNFPSLNVSNGTSFASTWLNCVGLTSFPTLDVSKGTNFNLAWQNCSNLVEFPALNFDSVPESTVGSTATGFRDTWRLCSKLRIFPSNVFNDSPCINFQDAFTNCGLTAESVDNILVSIESNGTSNGRIDIAGGLNEAPEAMGRAARTALIARGWTVNVATRIVGSTNLSASSSAQFDGEVI
jgi:hypothetical protein